ncbi:MAG: PilZ domain-containing protein [Deltaproteobacteria bacterium]|nr:PilZ domain-containing protein [Deltaproteobacteria bacterium]
MVLGIKSRGQPRAKVRWPVQIRTSSGSVNGETQNISTSGAFIFCRDSSNLEDNLQMVIKVPHSESLSIMARVVWKTATTVNERSPGSGIGVQFSHISPSDRQLLRNLIAEHSGKN